MENVLILFRKDKDVRAGKERTYHYISGEFRTHPDDSHKTPQQSFAKLLPLLPPSPLKPRWTGRFKGWWHHLFLYRKRAAATTFTCFLPRNDRWRGKNRRRRRTKRREKETGTDRQNYGCIQTKTRLQSVKTTVTIQWNSGYILTELKLQPDGTVVSTGWN